MGKRRSKRSKNKSSDKIEETEESNADRSSSSEQVELVDIDNDGDGEVTPTKAVKIPGVASIPADLKTLRACLICSLVKTKAEFQDDGCDNCEPILQLAGTTGAIKSYTSENFEGMIGMMHPTSSWVAKWQNLITFQPGIYAVNVRGKLADWVKEEFQDAGGATAARNSKL